MLKLEILQQFKNRFGAWINPQLVNVKYCQTQTDAFVELYIGATEVPQIITLDFYGADYEEGDELKNANDLLLFKPNEDIVDNAKRLIDLDAYSLIMGPDQLFTEKAIDEIQTNINQLNEKR